MLKRPAVIILLSLCFTTPVRAGEKIALRAANGRFLRACDDGAIRADSFLPGERATFELLDSGKQEIALKGPGGRDIELDGQGRTLRLKPLANAVATPGSPAIRRLNDASYFALVAAGDDRFALRPRGANTFVLLNPAAVWRSAKNGAGPAPGETATIYRVRPMPNVQTVFSTVLPAVAAAELAGKQYDKSGTHETNKYIELPAPTLKDPRHKKKVRVLATTEEYRIAARLDGKAEIGVPTLLYLANYAENQPGVVVLAVDAGLPVTGRVHFKVPNVASGSTGYSARIHIAAVAEVGVRREGGDAKLGPCKVTDMRISFARLDLSNDLLEAARRPIKSILNHELDRNADRLRQSANEAIEKAIKAHDVNLPLLGYLGLP